MLEQKEVIYDMDEVRRKFAKAMNERTSQKRQEGFSGWAESECRRSMRQRIGTRIRQGKWVDVANFAMFLWNLDGRKSK